MLGLARQIAAWLLIPLLVVSVVCGVAGRALAASVELFDANIRYTSGIFLPLSSYRASTIQPLTTATWTSAARAISPVAADGVSLILIRVTLPGGRRGAVRVSLSSGEPDTDPGSLWAVDDRHVVDASRLGGDIDDPREPSRKLAVRSVGGGGQRFAFLLYRAPRNFDSASGSTSPLASRQAWLTVEFSRSSSMVSITIVRPLIVFIHGTGDDNDAWAQFPLWQNSANELGDFQPGTLPFQATRISFYWIWNSTGGVQENAETILPQLVTALRDWREATATAATQADVVTHSFGGFIARQVAPVILRELVEREHPLPVLIEHCRGCLEPLRPTPVLVPRLQALRLLLCGRVVDLRELAPGVGLEPLRDLVEGVDDPMVPAPLFLRVGVDVPQPGPDSQVPVPDH